tara:strand:- start:24 stop:206 length:183 start_codon:yes stop_codon:yes gene_type:complete
MKQYTLRQIQDLPFEEKDKVLSEPCELGFKTSGPKAQFKVLGVYLPLAKYKELKGESDVI